MQDASDPARTEVRYAVFDTAAGPCGLAWSAAGLTHVQLPEADRAETEARLAARSGGQPAMDVPPEIAGCMARMCAYFDGEAVAFDDVGLDMRGLSEFHTAVYTKLRTFGWGEATSYGALAALAALVGDPGAARAIGMAMGQNPWPLIVPCHRVLAASGKLGGFSAHGGRETKRHMLQLERIDADGAAPLLPGLFD